MSGFNFDYDSFDGSQRGFGDMQFDADEFPWDNPEPGSNDMPMFRNNRRARYNDAYGDYRGGYGPGGGYGPRPMLPPPPPLLPPQPPRSAMWGRGFGPGGPPRRHPNDDRAIKYLMRCGVTKEHLKNLPHDLLMMIQPEHCGLCDFGFESFTMSRMHYISKNHLKNQKKWQTKGHGSYQNNEMPFKSRNLYCELCDIQITSKAHGDAHYEGKPHRGIVDGRKKPKNPLLLQSGMESRLEQLIRREKRCIKPSKDKVAEDEPMKDVKSIAPELYCDICKTTVTCSEQMTMHMNGKKHLTKEKQHILNMMKGKPVSNNQGGEGEAYTGDKNQKDEDEDGTNPTEKDQEKGEIDDWGNEAWDNQEGTAAKA